MRRLYRPLLAVIGTMLVSSAAMGQQSVPWQTSLDEARTLAARTNRLVLVHFWAEYCDACHRMDRGVLNQPNVAAEMQASYVPVRINAQHAPAIVRQFGVAHLPADVVITPQGQLVRKLEGMLQAPQYVAWLRNVAVAARNATPAPTQTAAVPTAVPTRPMPNHSWPPPTPPPTPTPPTAWQAHDARYQQQNPSPPIASEYGAGQVGGGGVPPFGAANPSHTAISQAQQPPTQGTAPPWATGVPPTHGMPPTSNSVAGVPPAQPPMGQAPPGRKPASPRSGGPPLGLDGCCPVQLWDDMVNKQNRWALGNRQWGTVYGGRTYLFVGPEQQRRFFNDPDLYAPVLSGNDVVMAVDQNRTVPGMRQHGVFLGNRVYLFASEANLEAFSRNPQRYVNGVLQATRPQPGKRW